MQSDRGNSYISVAYHYDANNIFKTPLNNRTGPCILNGITKILGKLRKQGLIPKLRIMNNEVSYNLRKYFEDSYTQFQMVTPHMHRINSEERSVRTFNNHFISALFTVNPLFPLYLWYHLLPQVTMTLNMLRQFRLNPEISAYEQVDGIHNFEQTPLAPLVCKVQIHGKPTKQLTYATHSVDVWYLGPSVHHYRCYTYYNIDTGGGATPDTIYFLPAFMKIPNYSSIYMSINAAAYLEKSF